MYIDACYLKLIKKHVALSATNLGAFPISSSAPVAVNITTVIASILRLRSTQWSEQDGSALSAKYVRLAG